MPKTRGQLLLLASAVIFFSLQLLPHRITTLHGAFAFAFLYPLAAVLLGILIVISIVACFAMWMSAKETISRRNCRRWCATCTLMLVAAIVTTVCSAAYSRGLPTGSFVNDFDQHLWSQRSSSEYVAQDVTERQKMLGDVIQTVVAGNTKEAIISQLGPSESDSYFTSSGRDLIYCTGPQRDSPFPIDSEWLLIWFDSNGHATRYEVWSD